jgi:ubiquinone/menaquinone biosynthesis C-methylase UbiE
VVPLLGWLLTRHIDAYRYLPRSVKLFLSPDELAATMERIGLRQVHYRRLALGTVTIHSGVLA